MNYQTEKHMMISLVAVTLSLTVGLVLINFVHGYVDGNNNGRDDVQEWENSMDYRIGGSDEDDDKHNRQIQCDIFKGAWNNTGDGSCNVEGKIIGGGLMSAYEKCIQGRILNIPAGQNCDRFSKED